MGLRIKSDESIIRKPSGVVEAKTVRRLLEDQRWCAEEVLNNRGIPSNIVPGVGGDHIPIEANGTRHADRGGDENAPAEERRAHVAARDPTMRSMYVTKAHIREYGAAEWCSGCRGIETRRSMPHKNECRMRIRTRTEQNEEVLEGLKKEQQRQDRHLEEAVARSVE